MTTTPVEERRAAAAAADESCPRCGAAREPDQAYCLECGLRLPVARGAVPALRRRWVRRLGWYPGDWVWLSLLTLVVAAAGAAAAIAGTKAREPAVETVVAATVVSSVHEPTVAPTPTVGSAPLPTAPEPTVSTTTPAATTPAGPPNGRTVWPSGRSGWTLVLTSYPKAERTTALATASRAAKAGLPDVGVLDSDNYSSLHPGYFVVFSGVYGSQARADAALRTARASGFAGAYTRPVSR
jgi:cell division septation protein DedD